MVKYALGYYKHQLVEEHHALTPDGSRYFGMLSLRSEYGDYTDFVGLRNSHDKSFPIGIAIGARVMVCDNLSMLGENIIKRKHTAHSKRDLPGLVAEVIEPLAQQRQLQHQKFDTYKRTMLSDQRADHAILSLYRNGVLNIQRVPDVVEQWQKPAHDYGPPSAWRLFNAVTHALTGRVAENPRVTADLHQVIDGVCEHVA